jgi:hypothetical protein
MTIMEQDLEEFKKWFNELTQEKLMLDSLDILEIKEKLNKIKSPNTGALPIAGNNLFL